MTRSETAPDPTVRRHTVLWSIAAAAVLVALAAMGLRDRGNERPVSGGYDELLAQLAQDPRLRLARTRDLVDRYADRASDRERGIAEAWYAYGLRLFYGESDFEGALRAFEEASRLDPDWAWPHNALGIVLFTMGDRTAAQDSFDRALTLAPAWSRPHSDMAILFRRAGDLAAAKQHIELAMELEPNAPMNWFNRAVVLDVEGNHDAARQLYEAVLEAVPGLPHAVYNLSCHYARQGDAENALPLLAEAIERESGFRAYARQDADFDPIRDTPRFQALVGTGGEDTGP